MKVIWLEPPNMSNAMRKLAHSYLRRSGFNLYDFQFISLTKGCLIKETKTRWVADAEKEPQFRNELRALQPDFIICNDKAALNYITGKYTSLAKCRGSIYNYNGVPALVLDELRQTKIKNISSWVLLQDLGKLKRWLSGKLREEPKFTYTVCHSVGEVKHMVENIAPYATMISVDIETTGTVISSIQYTILWQTDHNTPYAMHTWNVPFINPLKSDGCHWETENEELIVWNQIRKINATKAIKVLQNGSYDAAYLLKYRVPLRNYLADSLHAWHSIWCEAPKRIDFIASIALDKYCYWKDEGKVEDDKEDKKGGKIPKDKEGLDSYWLYGALDTHNTLLCFRFILAVMIEKKLDWAIENYRQEMRQQFGPALWMTMQGVKINPKLQQKFALEFQDISDKARADLQLITGDPNFNPNSWRDIQVMVYDVLMAKPYGRGKQRRSTDEKVLTMVADQSNIFIQLFIEKLWECKKNANNVSKYGSGISLNGRFMSKSCAGVTETGRYASKAHDFWVGTNAQNVPYVMRPMLEADDGYILFDIDYSQSDAYFTAHESGDEAFIANMMGPNDVHCLHAEFFFKMPYEKLYNGHKAKEDWVSHNVTGVRSITKRVVYGANYLMAGATLLLTMSRKPVQAAAAFLKIKGAYKLPDRALIKLCDAFLAKYFKMYPRLKEWLYDEAIPKAVAAGNKASCAFGRTRIFFGNLADSKTQREFAAFFGQGGTAGNINKALDNIYYGMHEESIADIAAEPSLRGYYRILESRGATNVLQNLRQHGVRLMFQVHDSIIGQVPKEKIWLVRGVQLAMANRVEINGRVFRVPTEAQVGLGWGKRMIDFHDDITIEEIEAADKTWWEKLK